jgi:hypothetical protein
MKDNDYNDFYDNPLDESFINAAWENMSRRLDTELPTVPVARLPIAPTSHRTWLLAAGLFSLLSLATWAGYTWGKYTSFVASTPVAAPQIGVPINNIGIENTSITSNNNSNNIPTTPYQQSSNNTPILPFYQTQFGQFLLTPIFFDAPTSSSYNKGVSIQKQAQISSNASTPSLVPNQLPRLSVADEALALDHTFHFGKIESGTIATLRLESPSSTSAQHEPKQPLLKPSKMPNLSNLHVALSGGVFAGTRKDWVNGGIASVLVAKKTGKWTFETGIVYTYLKENQQINYGIIVPEKPIGPSTGGAGNSPSRQVNTGFHVNNLHYFGLPIGVSCRLNDRFSVNTGVQFNHLVRINISEAYGAPSLEYSNARFFNANPTGFNKDLGNDIPGTFNHNNIGAIMGLTYHLSSKLGIETNYYWNLRPYWKSYEGHQNFYHGNLQMGLKYWLR